MTDSMKCLIKDIAGYCGLYKISADGRVYRFYKNGNKRELGGNVSHGYMRVRLSMGNKARWYSVHRLVADAFIANPKKLPQINHKNGIKLDNRVENLEWCTASENVQHAFKLGLNKNTKKQYELAKAATAKPVVCVETGEEYLSLTDAGKAKGVSFSHIGQCALGKRQTAGGYHWIYSDSKKAQRQLRTVKDRCVKKVKAKEREIANYLNGINVRNKEIETLHKQLQEAQGALEDIIYFFDVVCQKDEMYFYDLIDNNIKKYREIAFITKHEE